MGDERSYAMISSDVKIHHNSWFRDLKRCEVLMHRQNMSTVTGVIFCVINEGVVMTCLT